MARLKREDLKKLLKECLLEILREEKILAPLKESFASNKNSTKSIISETNPYSSNQSRTNNNNSSANNSPTINNNKNTALIESINSVANAFGKQSSMFADLLADTAMTTLQAQRNGGLPTDRLGDGMILESYVEEEHKDDVNKLQALAPDGDVKKWAKFAFAKKE